MPNREPASASAAWRLTQTVVQSVVAATILGSLVGVLALRDTVSRHSSILEPLSNGQAFREAVILLVQEVEHGERWHSRMEEKCQMTRDIIVEMQKMHLADRDKLMAKVVNLQSQCNKLGWEIKK